MPAQPHGKARTPVSISRTDLLEGGARRIAQAGLLLSRPVVAGLVRATDVLVVVAAGFLAGWLRYGGGEPEFPDLTRLVHLSGSLAAALSFALALSYDFEALRDAGRQIGRLATAWSLSVGGVLVLLYALKSGEAVSRLWVGYWWLAGLLGLIAFRAATALAIGLAQEAGYLRRAVVLVGNTEARERLARELDADSGRGICLVAGLPFPDTDGGRDEPDPLRRYPELAAILHTRRVDEVILVTDAVPAGAVDALVRWLRTFPVSASLAAEYFDRRIPLLALTRIGDTPLLRVVERPLDGWQRVLKALEDRILGTLFLVLAAPVMAVIALAVKLTSPGPILYRQLRHGFNQQPIEVLKFRTMYVDRCDPPDAAQVCQARRHDPRVTPLGRILRRTSLDELPQLINVVRGEMSLVGPRPHALAHNEIYAALIDGYLARHRVKPGITGWAQVNGCRGETTTVAEMERRARLDLEYIESWSLLADLVILLRTIGEVFRARRAW